MDTVEGTGTPHLIPGPSSLTVDRLFPYVDTSTSLSTVDVLLTDKYFRMTHGSVTRYPGTHNRRYLKVETLLGSIPPCLSLPLRGPRCAGPLVTEFRSRQNKLLVLHFAVEGDLTNKIL